MDDINSGVTYRNQNTIILWRGGHDFGKVLIHEMIHLMANDTDEADTEAHALDLHCMTLANTYDEYLSIKEKQIQKSLALAEKMRGVDAGTTNGYKYFVDAVRIWTGDPRRGCPECHGDGGEDEEFVITL